MTQKRPCAIIKNAGKKPKNYLRRKKRTKRARGYGPGQQ